MSFASTDTIARHNRLRPMPRRNRRPRFTLTKVDVWALVILLIPLYANFYPLESYLAGGDKEISLPLPVTSISLVIISLTVYFFYLLIVGKRRFFHDYYFYIFILCAFASILYSPNPQATFQRALRLLPMIGLGVVFAQYYSLEKMLRLMVIGFFISALVSIFLSVAVPQLGLSRIGGAYEAAWRGANVQKNGTGNLNAIAMIIIYGSWRMRVITTKFAMIVAAPCLLMLAMAQSGTAAIGAFIVIAASFPLYHIQRYPKSLRIYLLLCVLFLAIAGSILGFMIVESIFAAAGRDMTFTGRTGIWAAVWEKIQERPLLGYGYGMWTMTSNSTRSWIQLIVGDTAAHSHNSWLDIWLQIGLFPLIVFSIIMIQAIRKALGVFVYENDKSAVLYIMLLLYLIIRSMIEVQFTDPLLNGLFWFAWISTQLKCRMTRRGAR